MTSTAFDCWSHQGIRALHVGAPDKTLLKPCFDLISVATKTLYESGDTDCLQYGPDLGDRRAIEELAKFLTFEQKDEVHADNLMFSAGASQGLRFLVTLFFTEGDLAIVEDPSYFIAIRALKNDVNMNVFPVASCEDGVDVDQLDNILTKHIDKDKMLAAKKKYWALVYLIPTFNNPQGTCLSEEKSKKLIKVLRKHKALAVCDDVYNLCYFMDDKPPFTTPPPKRLIAFDKESDEDYQGNVISNGSFSKIMGPGLRLGWIEAPKHVLTMFVNVAFLRSGGCFNHYASCVMREAMKLGLVSKHLAMLREVYHSRMTVMCNAIDKFLPSAKYTRPKGGYFVWLTFPEHFNIEKVSELCKEKYKVFVPAGRQFSCAGNFPNCMRLSFAYFPEQILVDCIEKLGLAFDEVTKN